MAAFHLIIYGRFWVIAEVTRAQLSMLLEGIDWRRPQANLDAGAGSMSDKRDSPVSMRVLW